MKKILAFLLMSLPIMTFAQEVSPDFYDTGKGQLKLWLLGHASILMEWNNKLVYVDPFSKVADYSTLPKADLILITHEHFDHFDSAAISTLTKPNTQIVLTEVCKKQLGKGHVLNNGAKTIIDDITIKAVPAYNIVHKKENGEFYHPKGRGNGYVLDIGKLGIYIAGDTEDIPEMQAQKDIDIAFLPKNLPYTMSDDMFVHAAKMVQAKNLYPYHYSNANSSFLTQSLKDLPTKIIVKNEEGLKF